ncbi:hypothetical protein SDC9_138625 [bioreactor metagenome]|uniref:Uncharacterized protein n=1 Tax=bioreactor metagenome TaxID=1076179 RepID=A0A645DPT9_9ZZZZ
MHAILRPFSKKLDSARVRELEEEMLRRLEHRLRARERGVGVDQLGRRIHRTTHLAVVAILILGMATRALTLDEAIRQEHVLLGVEELLDGARFDEPSLLQVQIDLLGQLVVLRAVGIAPVIEGNVKAIEILLAPGSDVSHELLRRLARLLGRNHDRRAMRIIRAHEVHSVALHSLRTHPGVGLDVLHDVADVEVAVGIRQRGRGENLACSHWVELSRGALSGASGGTDYFKLFCVREGARRER